MLTFYMADMCFRAKRSTLKQEHLTRPCLVELPLYRRCVHRPLQPTPPEPSLYRLRSNVPRSLPPVEPGQEERTKDRRRRDDRSEVRAWWGRGVTVEAFLHRMAAVGVYSLGPQVWCC